MLVILGAIAAGIASLAELGWGALLVLGVVVAIIGSVASARSGS